jgi:formate dehydrogenase subunit gamma
MKTHYRRFSTARIVEHWLQMITFSVLVVTGLSQKYYTLGLAQWFIAHLGGIDMVRYVHRGTGIVFSLALALHIGAAVFGLIYKRWQPSMIITKNDITNAIHNIKYYLGRENYPALSGRYNYTQKFEYWGILTGGLLMVVTGAVLWQPLFATKFVTGEIIPASKVLHTNEALVVFLIIAVWHIYNAIFSPGVFPLNTSIFSGYLSRERMAHDHILELARIERTTPEEMRMLHPEECPFEVVPQSNEPAGPPDCS